MPEVTRRNFLRTSAGFTAVAVLPGFLYACSPPDEVTQEAVCSFCAYRPGETLGTVTAVTPEDGYFVHTFFDVNPFSPSGRYLALTRFPFQDRKPILGDVATVAVLDLEEETIRTVYATQAWGYQLGANVQWGTASDRWLYTNDVIDGKAVGVRIDLETGNAMAYAGPKYDVAPDESFFIGGNLDYMNAVQYGYGIPDGPSNEPNLMEPDDKFTEGIWKTSLAGDTVELLVPFADFEPHLADPEWYEDGTFYPFHTKVNSKNTKVMQVLRARLPGDKGDRNSSLFTFDVDGSNIVEAIDREAWAVKGDFTGGGNHPSWHPNGEEIVMNLVPRDLGYENMRICSFATDGSNLRVLSENHLGSGHPSVDPTGTYIVVDAYPKEEWVAADNGEIPIRLIDMRSDEEQTVCMMNLELSKSRYDRNAHPDGGSHYKLDAHPAWNQDGTKIAFNGVIDDVRRVFIADLEGVV